MYKVFEIDAYFSTYGMYFILIGAIDEDDLKKHITQEILGAEDEFYPAISDKEFIEKLEEEKRIREIPNVFTDTPYVILSRYCYWE